MAKLEKIRLILRKHNEGLGSNDDTINAILAELREPDERMLLAAHKSAELQGRKVGEVVGIETFQAMIDAIE